jgi:hypothetical protein
MNIYIIFAMIIGISASLKQDIICRYNLQDCQRIEKYQIKEGNIL